MVKFDTARRSNDDRVFSDDASFSELGFWFMNIVAFDRNFLSLSDSPLSEYIMEDCLPPLVVTIDSSRTDRRIVNRTDEGRRDIRRS